jgi:hypothetical protein
VKSDIESKERSKPIAISDSIKHGEGHAQLTTGGLFGSRYPALHRGATRRASGTLPLAQDFGNVVRMPHGSFLVPVSTV